MRDVEREVSELEGEVDDLDLLKELILQKLTFAFKGEKSAEEFGAAAGAGEEARPAGGQQEQAQGDPGGAAGSGDLDRQRRGH